MSRFTKHSIAAVLMLAFASPALAAGTAHSASPVSISQVQKTQFVDAKGVAIRGYDPVSYFSGEGHPGEKQFASKYQGATYLFASAGNKAKFDAKPAAYAPQFGGYCAYGTAVGKKFKTSPDTGKMVDGKLYFNLDKSIQAKWNADIPGFIKKANVNWPTVQKRDIDG